MAEIDTFERVKMVRKACGLSQEEFANRIYLSRSVIVNIENRRVPEVKDSIIRAICGEYHIDFNWLTTGEGDMFTAEEDYIINGLANEFQLDDLDKKIVESYLKLSHDQRMVVKNFLKQIFDK